MKPPRPLLDRRSRRAMLACLLAAACASGPASGPRGGDPPPGPKDREFDAAVADLLALYWAAFPTAATAAGVHERDAELENVDAEALGRVRDRLAGSLGRLDAIGARDLSPDRRVDHEILSGWLRWRLVEMDRIRVFQTDPGLYVGLAGEALFNLFVRESAPALDRARAAIGRLRALPRFFAAARANLGENASRLAVETAARDARGTVSFLDDAVRAFLVASTHGDPLAAEVAPAIDAASAAARGFAAFLESDLAPRAKGAYVFGRERFVEKSLWQNGVTLAPEQIESRGRQEVERLRAEMVEVAHAIAPGRTVDEAIEIAGRDHPTAAGLLDAYRARQDELRAFVRKQRLATIPAGDRLEILETPEFARSTISAAVYTAGPFETADVTTYYVVTPIDTSLPESEQQSQLAVDHALGLIDVVSIHEAYPGHHVAHLHEQAVDSPARKLVHSWIFDEGWAHYAEQMVIDAGYHASPATRMFQLKDALLRACRMVVDPSIHVGGMTWEDARVFYRSRCHQGEVTAEMEARRAALNPATVYTYTLGKLWIQALAAHEKRRLGDAFGLGAFHDRLLSHGSVPLPLLARAYFGVTLGVP
jgi:uncharacterized protein (DUF885 family)